MDTNKYLKAVLEKETLKEDSAEFKALVAEESKVRKLLEEHFEEAKPAVKTGGSRAKGTMIKSNYDLDITCYFDRADDDAGESLEDIFNNVKVALGSAYFVNQKPHRSVLKAKTRSRRVNIPMLTWCRDGSSTRVARQTMSSCIRPMARSV